MDIEYKSIREFTPQELQELFLSVNWSSGNYPDRLVAAMKNSATVFTAWDNQKLVGLINVLDDSVMTAYIHYLLIMPEYQHAGIGKKLMEMVIDKYKSFLRILLVAYDRETEFYKHCGFEIGEEKVPMFITSLWT
ncbi:MAG: GNAT family N-acetyltransferase [Prevotellaceae bacterium]|jgi:ribosomal protein S18 acetylase RimI-like enzyme|nr:GNAT family N-acetyltransferase [Prevotellaceae bacterium]